MGGDVNAIVSLVTASELARELRRPGQSKMLVRVPASAWPGGGCTV